MTAGDTRGTSFVTWWNNRQSVRRDAAATVRQFRELQLQLSQAAGDAKPAAANLPATASLAELQQKAETALASLADARSRPPKLNASIVTERNNLQKTISNVRGMAAQRVRQAAEAAARDQYQRDKAALERNRTIKKLASVLLAIVILVVLLVY